jgi:thiopurine S-methyltransferase
MQPDFWHDRWQRREIGFHQAEPHRALDALWATLGVAPHSRVFVPLAGKSLDMRWLAERGHRVIGIELCEIAVREFFQEAGLEPKVAACGSLTAFTAGAYDLYCGDFFSLTADLLGDVTAVFDRAALIALPPAMRQDYVTHMLRILPRPCAMLLVTLEYDQSRMPGPPHSVMAAEVRELYRSARRLELLHRDDQLPEFPRFRDKGLDALAECVYRIAL